LAEKDADWFCAFTSSRCFQKDSNICGSTPGMATPSSITVDAAAAAGRRGGALRGRRRDMKITSSETSLPSVHSALRAECTGRRTLGCSETLQAFVKSNR
jgi:hypothetical protein